MYDIKNVASRLKDLREFSDIDSASFAARLGVTESDYLDYESGAKDIPIGLLYNIASTLDVDPTYMLFGKSSTKTAATIVYKGNGTEIERYDGYSFVSLNADFINRNFEPMLVTIKEGVTPELVKHTGQEFNYVLEGGLRVIVGEKEYYLRAGDSIYFLATVPHAQIAMGGDATFLTVIQK